MPLIIPLKPGKNWLTGMYTVKQLALKYFQYYRLAANSKGHGIHSPFVFEFIKFVKNDRAGYPAYEKIEARRNWLLKNNSVIKVEDFGAGSTVIKTKDRQVSKIAASSLKPVKFAQLLHRMARYYNPQTIVELGTSFGITTAYLAAARPQAQVITFEGSDAIAAIASDNFARLGLGNIELIPGDFNKTLREFLSRTEKIDMAFIDGNHSMQPTIDYFHALLQRSHNDTILIFDDIHWSHGMEQAWEHIKANESVTLSIDLFFIGIVFLKKEFRQKQHFSIRF